MDFRFSDEQHALVALARSVARRPTAEAVHASGLAQLLVPEELGGAGTTLVEGAILAEELGRALAPCSLAGSWLIAVGALDLLSSDEDRKRVVGAVGSDRTCSVTVGLDLAWPPAGDGLAWGWTPEALVLAPDGESLKLVELERGTGLATEDLSLTVAAVGSTTPSPELVATTAGRLFRATTAVVTSALLVGHMAAVLELAVAYALEREQFGVRIGSFQAVKHMCADMLVDLEASRSAVYGAAAIIAGTTDVAAAERAASVAKGWCGDAAVRVCELALQVHGGIGFTWECDVHRHLRAAHSARVSFMTPDQALDLIAGAGAWT